MKNLLLGVALILAAASSGSTGDLKIKTRTLTQVSCLSTKGEAAFALNLYEHDLNPGESYGPLVEVFMLEDGAASEGRIDPIWKHVASDTKGASQRTHWSGILVCDRKSGKVWVFVLASVSVRHQVEAYEVDLSKRVARPSEGEIISGSAILDHRQPKPVATLRAEFESCSLGITAASWTGPDVDLEFSPESDRCKSFRAKFDPNDLNFKDIPKEWSRY